MGEPAGRPAKPQRIGAHLRAQGGAEPGAEHKELLPRELHQRLQRAGRVVAVHREHVAPVAEVQLEVDHVQARLPAPTQPVHEVVFRFELTRGVHVGLVLVEDLADGGEVAGRDVEQVLLGLRRGGQQQQQQQQQQQLGLA